MGVAIPRAPVGTRSPGPPQKFGHRPLFVGQLLSRKQVSQKKAQMTISFIQERQ